MGKLAKPWGAAAGLVSQIVARPPGGMIDGVVGEALRASFEPVINEPMPDRLREMIDKIRIEELQQRGRKP